MSAAGWQDVPIPGGTTRILHKDVAELKNLKRQIGSTERTHVVVLPSPEQGRRQFDATLGALQIVGMFGMVSNLPGSAWYNAIIGLQELMKSIERAHPGLGPLWTRVLDSDMLSRALAPLFDELRQASRASDLPICDHLVLVGCEDGAWVLHAFLHELYRHGVTPSEQLTLVALGASTNTLLGKAVNAVYPARLEGRVGSSGRIKYISMFGAVPDRKPRRTGGKYPDAHRDDTVEITEAMTCLSTKGNEEECILSTQGMGSSMGDWITEPRTAAKWLSRSLSCE